MAAAARATLSPARLQVEVTGAFVALPMSASALVGRADPASSFYPDVDLTPYGALENGVGRRHLRLALDAGRMVVEDLDSTNGTALNGQRLAPRQAYPISPGDTLTVGRLALRLVE
jgi:pSer/pThr/pTyr-binding forkhead associated (FHA) protein